MQDQPKMFPQRGSALFADHRGARPQVVNTVARGQLREDSYYYTGVAQGANGQQATRSVQVNAGAPPPTSTSSTTSTT